ncbi:unnamed protein product [Protopolystoma xenopodis]|uniref:Uncharacterized protein n=1 Tax=Protopolystoma xenopodis TaxID=117903 RepID=A0A3S5AGA6_9PLAT|nr:unnamed protein product [Protopolystoma xenopodis]
MVDKFLVYDRPRRNNRNTPIHLPFLPTQTFTTGSEARRLKAFGPNGQEEEAIGSISRLAQLGLNRQKLSDLEKSTSRLLSCLGEDKTDSKQRTKSKAFAAHLERILLGSGLPTCLAECIAHRQLDKTKEENRQQQSSPHAGQDVKSGEMKKMGSLKPPNEADSTRAISTDPNLALMICKKKKQKCSELNEMRSIRLPSLLPKSHLAALSLVHIEQAQRDLQEILQAERSAKAMTRERHRSLRAKRSKRSTKGDSAAKSQILPSRLNEGVQAVFKGVRGPPVIPKTLQRVLQAGREEETFGQPDGSDQDDPGVEERACGDGKVEEDNVSMLSSVNRTGFFIRAALQASAPGLLGWLPNSAIVGHLFRSMEQAWRKHPKAAREADPPEAVYPWGSDSLTTGQLVGTTELSNVKQSEKEDEQNEEEFSDICTFWGHITSWADDENDVEEGEKEAADEAGDEAGEEKRKQVKKMAGGHHLSVKFVEASTPFRVEYQQARQVDTVASHGRDAEVAKGRRSPRPQKKQRLKLFHRMVQQPSLLEVGEKTSASANTAKSEVNEVGVEGSPSPMVTAASTPSVEPVSGLLNDGGPSIPSFCRLQREGTVFVTELLGQEAERQIELDLLVRGPSADLQVPSFLLAYRERSWLRELMRFVGRTDWKVIC